MLFKKAYIKKQIKKLDEKIDHEVLLSIELNKEIQCWEDELLREGGKINRQKYESIERNRAMIDLSLTFVRIYLLNKEELLRQL